MRWPSLSCPTKPDATRSAWRMALSKRSSTARASARNICPSGVSATDRVVRPSKVKPRVSSSWRMVWLNVG
ncbi:hypothetical protein SANTM175S_05801 [Streptomyces antimycoticus]